MVDFRGRDIHVGDRIVYPNRHGSTLWMNEAEVDDIYSTSIIARRIDTGRIVEIFNPDRVVVVQ